MLKNFWYACEFSHRVKTAPLPVTVLGESLVLFRQRDGKLVCLKNRCAHRGDELSRGQVRDDCLVCPYHGWKYNAEGQCVHIPSNQAGQNISKKAAVKGYAAREVYGFVWVFMGDIPEGERPPIPALPEFDEPGWRSFYFDWEVAAHYSRVTENAIDVSHLPFLHSATYGEKQNPIFELENFVEGEWGGEGRYRHESMAPGLLRLRWPRPIESVTTFTYHLPCITSTRAELSYGTVLLFMSHLPVSAHETRILYLCMRNFYRAPLFDRFVKLGSMKIFLEDKDSVEQQKPLRAPLNFAEELHVKADALPLAMRKIRRRCAKAGWCIEEPPPEVSS